MASSELFATAYTCETDVPHGLARILRQVDHKPSTSAERHVNSSDQSRRLGVWQQPYSIPAKRQIDKDDAHVLPRELPVMTKPALASSRVTPGHKAKIKQPLYRVETCLSAIPVGGSGSSKKASAEHAGRRKAQIEGLPLKHLSPRELQEMSYITARFAPEPSPPRYLEYLRGEPQTVRRYSECIAYCTS